MNTHTLFLTIHGHGVSKQKILDCLRIEYPEWDISISDEGFENERE